MPRYVYKRAPRSPWPSSPIALRCLKELASKVSTLQPALVTEWWGFVHCETFEISQKFVENLDLFIAKGARLRFWWCETDPSTGATSNVEVHGLFTRPFDGDLRAAMIEAKDRWFPDVAPYLLLTTTKKRSMIGSVLRKNTGLTFVRWGTIMPGNRHDDLKPGSVDRLPPLPDRNQKFPDDTEEDDDDNPPKADDPPKADEIPPKHGGGELQNEEDVPPTRVIKSEDEVPHKAPEEDQAVNSEVVSSDSDDEGSDGDEEYEECDEDDAAEVKIEPHEA
jgi:hypothetical protein